MDTKTPFKVRVKDTVPGYVAVREFTGEILEVTDTGDGFYRPTVRQSQVFTEKGSRNVHFTIDKENAVVVTSGSTEFTPFELRSGMTFKDESGRVGLIVGTDKGLVAMFSEDGSYCLYSDTPDHYMAPSGKYDHLKKFVEVYEGMNSLPTAGLGIPHLTGKKVWERQNTSVKLNDEYTAQVSKDGVVVGCQTIPMDAIREILAIADKL